MKKTTVKIDNKKKVDAKMPAVKGAKKGGPKKFTPPWLKKGAK